MTELEQKAEEYTKYIFENQKYTSYSCFDCKRLHEHNEQFGIGEQEVLRLLKQAYKDGYEQGQESMMFDFAIKYRQTLLKEIEVLTQQIEKMKCCGNCKFCEIDGTFCYAYKQDERYIEKCCKWELAE